METQGKLRKVRKTTADACCRTVDWEQGQHLCTLGNWRKLRLKEFLETRGKFWKVKETIADAWHHTVKWEQSQHLCNL